MDYLAEIWQGPGTGDGGGTIKDGNGVVGGGENEEPE